MEYKNKYKKKIIISIFILILVITGITIFLKDNYYMKVNGMFPGNDLKIECMISNKESSNDKNKYYFVFYINNISKKEFDKKYFLKRIEFNDGLYINSWDTKMKTKDDDNYKVFEINTTDKNDINLVRFIFVNKEENKMFYQEVRLNS